MRRLAAWCRDCPCDSSMASRLEQFNRIAVGIFNLNLFAARAHLHFISETQTRVFQLSNARRQILHLKKHTVPSAGLLLTAIGHWPGPGGARTAQDQLEAANGNLAECGQVLHVQMEAKSLRIKGNCTLNIFDLISNTPKSDNGSLRRMRYFRLLLLVLL